MTAENGHKPKSKIILPPGIGVSMPPTAEETPVWKLPPSKGEEVKDKTEKNRNFLAEKTSIAPSLWSDEAVRFVMASTPDPLLWKNRIMIAVPLGELGYARFWQQLTTVNHIGWHIDQGLFVSNGGQYLPGSHNKLIADCLKRDDWNYILFLEHDHEFPANMLETVGTYTDPIVGGLYFNRVPEDPQPVCYNWNSNRTAIKRLQPYEVAPMLDKPGLYDVDVVPMGCTAIRRDVLEQWPMEVPWFHAPGADRRDTDQMSDDVWFCRKAQEQGWTIKVDTRILPTHMGLVPFHAGMYIKWFEYMKSQGKTAPVVEAPIPS